MERTRAIIQSSPSRRQFDCVIQVFALKEKREREREKGTVAAQAAAAATWCLARSVFCAAWQLARRNLKNGDHQTGERETQSERWPIEQSSSLAIPVLAAAQLNSLVPVGSGGRLKPCAHDPVQRASASAAAAADQPGARDQLARVTQTRATKLDFGSKRAAHIGAGDVSIAPAKGSCPRGDKSLVLDATLRLVVRGSRSAARKRLCARAEYMSTQRQDATCRRRPSITSGAPCQGN